ncbi:MAG: hypothetical protein M3069_06455 [Chloroflexota bacterium]|nr:hypothetical protein [Chloroflexota bacterium]
MLNIHRIRAMFFAAVSLGIAATISVSGTPAVQAEDRDASDIVNLAHLDFLHATVPDPITPPAGHGTTDPGVPIDTWWVYANANLADGTYTPTGGGNYDVATRTYGQGAFDTDDVARAAVVYLIHHRYYRDQHSLRMARGALRFVMYMQTTTGPNAGNFVLWMQPDGTLNLTPSPPDSPNPADAGPSYWLARSLWALGEGYATFRSADPAFASALRARMELGMAKLDQELVGPNANQYYTLHGYRTPRWFIADGADASSEALLGLSAYYAATHSPEAEKLATAFGNGIARFQLGSARDWPWQALLPWARSVSEWHAWGAHMSMGLSSGAQALGQTSWLAAAERDANLFETHQLVSFGPVNGLLPAPDDTSQIAYGAETTANGLLSVGRATGKRVYRELGGIAATWFFGNNSANAIMYQQHSGVVYDGINADGSVNHNSGAESTIEGLLAIMSVANDPVARTYLSYDRVAAQTSYQKVEAESGVLTGSARVVKPASAWTGEAQWSNAAYVDMLPGGQVSLPVNATTSGQYAVYLVFDKQTVPSNSVGVRVSVDGVLAGTDDEGGAGAQGDSPNSDYLWINTVVVPRPLTAGSHTVTLAYLGDGATSARIDAILLQPLIENKVLTDAEHNALAVYKSLSPFDSSGALPQGEQSADWKVRTYNRNGVLVEASSVRVGPNSTGRVPVVAYGYTLALQASDHQQ